VEEKTTMKKVCGKSEFLAWSGKDKKHGDNGVEL